MPLFPQLTEECKEKRLRECRTNKISWIGFFVAAFVSFSFPWISPLIFDQEIIKRSSAIFAETISLASLMIALAIAAFSVLIRKAHSGSSQFALFMILGMYIGLMIGLSIWLYMT